MSIKTLDQLFSAFERHGARHYGEQVSQLEHALQCGDIAHRDGAADSLIAAALLHDYGHFVEADAQQEVDMPALDEMHEVLGANVLSGLFGPDVVMPIALHVSAKRYLCAMEAGYLEGLSAASLHSLHLQGGVFTPAQAAQFETLPYHQEAIRLRRYDDQAKEVGAKTRPLAAYRDMLGALIAHADNTV